MAISLSRKLTTLRLIQDSRALLEGTSGPQLTKTAFLQAAIKVVNLKKGEIATQDPVLERLHRLLERLSDSSGEFTHDCKAVVQVALQRCGCMDDIHLQFSSDPLAELEELADRLEERQPLLPGPTAYVSGPSPKAKLIDRVNMAAERLVGSFWERVNGEVPFGDDFHRKDWGVPIKVDSEGYLLAHDGISCSRLRLFEKIGEGATSVLIKAMAENGEIVAVKFLKPDLPQKVKDSFWQEAIVTSGVFDDRYVDRGIAISSDGKSDIPFLTMAFLTGKPLIERIYGRRSQALPLPGRVSTFDADGKLTDDIAEIIRIAWTALVDMLRLHNADCIHGDVKPENLMITADPHNPNKSRGWIIDFGSVRYTKNVHTDFSGTPGYLAPELFNKQGSLNDIRSDLFSFGVVLYEMLTGINPFRDPSITGIGTEDQMAHLRFQRKEMAAIKRGEKKLRAPNELNSKIPTALSDIVMKLLKFNPNERYRNVKTVIFDLISVQAIVAWEIIRERLHARGPNREIKQDYAAPLKLVLDANNNLKGMFENEPEYFAEAERRIARVEKFAKRHNVESILAELSVQA